MALTNYVVGTTAHPGGTWTIENTNTAQTGRYHDLAGLAEGSNSPQFSTSRPGCFPGPADASTEVPGCFAQSAGGGLSVAIRAGSAVVERSTLVGPYIVVSEAVATVTLATADATNARIDRVDLQVLDGLLGDNGGVSQTAFVVTTGVAAGSPVAPAAPANSIPITQIHLPANTVTITAGMIFDVRRSAGLRGGIRMMLPGDLLADIGFNSGEWRDTAGVPGALDTVDRWNQATAAWEHVIDRSGAVSKYANLSTSINTFSTTTYSGLRDVSSNLCGTAFVAPASGAVRIAWGGNFRQNTSGVASITITVNQGSTVGSGTSVVTGQDANAFQVGVGNILPGQRSIRISGLTPGSTYNTSITWKVSGGTVDANNPWLEVQPVA